MFQAVYLDKPAGTLEAGIRELPEDALPEGDVLVRVEWSTLNYKDGLAITGKAPVVRKFPMVPGIDFAGTVEASQHPAWRPGDRVLLNGWGVGEGHWGGLAQKARVRGDWLLARPENLSARQCMAIGTAGYTAMLCVQALERHDVLADSGEVLVTGAAGGVGSIAIQLLARRGYRVVASTGRVDAAGDYLRGLGAAEVIDRAQFSAPGKPLGRERWAGAVDTVGSHTLANVCATTRYDGVVTACGLAGGMDLPATVAPFILRGVTLAGIDSVLAPLARRQAAWQALATEIDTDRLDELTRGIALAEAIPAAAELLAGSVRGRLVVDVNA